VLGEERHRKGWERRDTESVGRGETQKVLGEERHRKGWERRDTERVGRGETQKVLGEERHRKGLLGKPDGMDQSEDIGVHGRIICGVY
jgi:hypothetical protein